MTLASRVVAIVIACGLGASASVADAPSAAAEALFREGRRLIQQREIAAGCAKLAASERLETSVGTLLNLGDCYERLGRFASAWAAFRKAEATAKRAGGDEKRQAEARRRALALEPILSNLVIDVAPERRLEGLVIKRNGEVVDAAAWSSAVPVDPGTYRIVAEAPGHRPWQLELEILAKTRRSVVVPSLEAATPAVTRVETHRGAATATWSTTRSFSVVLAVVGAGALGGGLYVGARSRELEDAANERCPLALCADPEGLRLNEDARDAALGANALYLSAGVALATATVLWFVGAPDARVVVAPAAHGDQVGASVAGSF